MSGFTGSLIGKISQPCNNGTRIIMGALGGGFSSSITGGKFINGATTGAFIVLFNDLIHDNYEIDRKFNNLEDASYVARERAEITRKEVSVLTCPTGKRRRYVYIVVKQHSSDSPTSSYIDIQKADRDSEPVYNGMRVIEINHYTPLTRSGYYTPPGLMDQQIATDLGIPNIHHSGPYSWRFTPNSSFYGVKPVKKL
jgi:hypothetical protein